MKITGSHPREIKAWTRHATMKWTTPHACSSCGTPLAGFPYRRIVYALERVVRNKRVSTELDVHFYCDKIGCAGHE